MKVNKTTVVNATEGYNNSEPHDKPMIPANKDKFWSKLIEPWVYWLIEHTFSSVRIKNKEILPEYVSLYFNSPDGQNKILETVAGSYIRAISRKKFEEEIKIPIPSLETQQSLIKLNQNIKQQEKIYRT